jgi:hypothetical protein
VTWRADEHAGAIQLDAQLIGFDWNRGRAGLVAAKIRMLLDGPSVNTVKMNLKSIYRKLAVATRSEAVEAARAAGLL